MDVFGGPARGSSQFIVTKRAGMSQFEAGAIAATHDVKVERPTSIFSQTISSYWIFLAAEKWRKPRRLPPMILITLIVLREESPLQPSGALVESAVPLEVLRIVPL